MITHYEKAGNSIKVFVGEKSLTLTDTMSVIEFEEQLQQWKTGTYIQDAFWMLTSGEREFMMTGTTPEEWEDMWGGFWEDDEDDEDV
jgi:hypothetical protein